MNMTHCHDFISKLIAQVRENTCLYYKRDPFYYNKEKKQEVWDAIGLVCGRSGKECKDRWKLLRERFCKHLKKIETHKLDENEASEEWQFFHELLFLKGLIVPRGPRFEQKIELVRKISNDIDAEDDSTSFSSGHAKRARVTLAQTETQHTDPLLYYVAMTPKVEPEDMCNGFGDKVDKSVETEPTMQTHNEMEGNVKRREKPNLARRDRENSADELFARHITCLMRDLPIGVKDKFQADMYAEVFRLRSLVRGGDS